VSARRSAAASRFGILPDGHEIRCFALERDGLRVDLMEYGASVLRVRAPDRAGRPGDVVLGLRDLAAYHDDRAHFGAVPGRFANRIAHGRCRVAGRELRLPANDGVHHLHGGERGLGRRPWRGELLQIDGDDAVRFEIASPAGDAGYPGRLLASATYRLQEGGALAVELRAECDEPTLVNLTQHAYFNLADGGASPVHDHVLAIAADGVLEIDDAAIPSGRILPVAGSAFDFREPARLGPRIEAVAGARGGFDHCFVLRGGGVAARLEDPGSGRSLEVETNQPGLQLYTGNFLGGSLASPDGIAYGRWHGLCLEPQAFPDAPNHPDFPQALLEPGDLYVHDSVFRFGVDGA
jgi:aldose 1-epimerase